MLSNGPNSPQDNQRLQITAKEDAILVAFSIIDLYIYFQAVCTNKVILIILFSTNALYCCFL